MNEHICAVCGETDIKKLTMFNYGVCLCHRCLEISAHSFIHDNAERKLKETEKKKKKKKESVDVEGMSKKMAEECSEEIGKAIFVERDDQPESINDLKKTLGKVKKDLRTCKAMYRNRLEKFTNLMNEHKKLMEDYNNVRKGQDSWSLKFVEVQLEANRYRKRCGELQEQLSECAKRANSGILAASAAGLIVGLILGYLVR